MNWKLILMLVLAGSTTMLSAQEIRLSAETNYKVSKKIKTEFMFQQRMSEHNMHSERSSIIQAKIGYKQNKHFSYAFGMRYKKELNLVTEIEHKNNDKYRITGDIKVKIPEHVKQLSVFNRMRFQQTLTETNNQWFIIRNQSSLKYKYSKVLSSNISYEIFYNTNSRAFILSRLKLKVDHDITKKLALSGTFMIDAPLNNQKFDHYYVYGLSVKYSI